jgi:nitrite reductase/ring-hydroxylating ferredoxin subunit/DMSO/TMAO reductase YedYZ heme-binding membrane subunit
MSNAYSVVQWNTHKKKYDLIMLSMIMVYLVSFVVLGMLFFPAPGDISPPILIIRALGTCAILLLHVILIIGPLARFTSKTNILLYNRRHLGVAFFCVAALHGVLTILFYGGFGVINPLSALLIEPFRSGGIPFEIFGFVALLIFALMAATSHDFWLKNLGPRFWKTMHMGVYVAYALVLAHVVLGALADEKNIFYPVSITVGAVTICFLHLKAGLQEVRKDHRLISSKPTTEWIDVCSVDDIPHDRAKIVQINTQERIAVFRYEDKLSAISNVCAHQGGPLGEGKVVDGCVTCPWHGYQYLPSCGQSPPPYTEKIPTYEIRIEGQRVLINPDPNEPGTEVSPAMITPAQGDDHE